MHVELAVDVLDVRAGGTLCNLQVAGDDGQGATVRQKHDDLALARRQAVISRHARAVLLEPPRARIDNRDGGCFFDVLFLAACAHGLRQLRHHALGQYHERHHHKAQRGQHGHGGDLHVPAGDHRVARPARHGSRSHSREHEGHAQPEDMQRVLVASTRYVYEQHPGEDVEELVTRVDQQDGHGGVRVEEQRNGDESRHHDGQRQPVGECGVEALAQLRHDDEEHCAHEDEREDGASADERERVVVGGYGIEQAAQERERHDREHELAHAELRARFFLGVTLRRRAGRGVVGIRVLDRGFLFGFLREVAPRQTGAVRFEQQQAER